MDNPVEKPFEKESYQPHECKEVIDQAMALPEGLICDDGRSFGILAWQPEIGVGGPASALIRVQIFKPESTDGSDNA